MHEVRVPDPAAGADLRPHQPPADERPLLGGAHSDSRIQGESRFSPGGDAFFLVVSPTRPICPW